MGGFVRHATREGPDIAAFDLLDMPHADAEPVRFDDVQGCVLFQRMPGKADDYFLADTGDDLD